MLRLPFMISRRSWLGSCALAVCCSSWATLAAGQAPDSVATRHAAAPQIRAAKATGPIRVDGVLDEPAWNFVEPATTFTQLDPDEGQPVSERTEVRVLVDGDALVIGARLYDREAGKIKARLARLR
jgi:hypothetical protein